MPRRRLTNAQITELRRLYSLRGPKTYYPSNLASMFGTSKATVLRLCANEPRGRRGPDAGWDADRYIDGPRLN